MSVPLFSNRRNRCSEETIDIPGSIPQSGRPWIRILWLLLLLAAVLKLTYFWQYAQLPFIDAPLFDSSVYLQQAEAIRSKRFDDPTLIAFSPLYGYVLAVLGSSAIYVQFALGLFNLVLLYRLTASRFNRTAALVAVALYFGYGLLLFYESKVLSETLGLTLALGAMCFFLSTGFGSARRGIALACGLLLGLAVLARANLIFSFPFFAAAAFLPWPSAQEKDSTAVADRRPLDATWHHALWPCAFRIQASLPRAFRLRLKRTALFCCGFGLVLGGNGLWNYANTGLFVPLTLVSRAISVGTAQPWKGSLSAHTVGLGAVSPWDVVDSARERLANPDDEQQMPSIDLLGWIKGSPLKLLTGLSDREISFQYGYYGERSEVPVLDLMPVTFQMIGCLAVVGSLVLVRRFGIRALLPYLPFILGAIATITLYHPSSRYRVVMVLPMLVLAGHGVATTLNIKDRKARGAALVSVIVVCGFLSYRTLTYELVHPGMWHLRVAEAEAVRGDTEAVASRVRKALEVEPNNAEVQARVRYIIGITRGRPIPPEP